MRIRRIAIRQWRMFERVVITIPDASGLVCLIGANGTGKSHLLELVASCAHRLGLSQGVEIPRGDPFNDTHDITLEFHVAEGVSTAVDRGLVNDPHFPEWNRSLIIHSINQEGRGNSTTIEGGGIRDAGARIEFAATVVGKLQQSKSVHFLFLDADRAYPKKRVDNNALAQAYDADWKTQQYTKGQSYRRTDTLYNEWLKFCLASESQASTKLFREMRRAKRTSGPDPKFEDHFEPYKVALSTILPHLDFTGVDTRKRTLLFDTTGLELGFDQLSGGEREIAFLIGQIERFGLRQGLFLLDEPELHLNADLIRRWVKYLLSTVREGQIWVATHSLEAVEAADQETTFVLERNEKTRKIDKADRLDRRPLLATLARALGTPAFSIAKLRFVFVEGEERLGERERFRSLIGAGDETRFIEGGSKSEVKRRVETVRRIAEEGGEGIRVGGVVDRDFDERGANAREGGGGVFVLGVHEIENLYLEPTTVELMKQRSGIEGVAAEEIIQEAADLRGGNWIFRRLVGMTESGSKAVNLEGARRILKTLSWAEIVGKQEEVQERVVSSTSCQQDERDGLGRRVRIAMESYKKRRLKQDLWTVCEGKEVLEVVAKRLGFNGGRAYQRAARKAWQDGAIERPEALIDLTTFVKTL